MIDLSVRGLVKGFEQGNDILKGITFDVNAGERVGILGRNGCGKTTFFRILSGELQPDAGTVSIASGRRLGLISQIPVYPDGWTTEDVLREAHRRLYDMEARMNELTARMATDDSPALLSEYDRLSDHVGLVPVVIVSPADTALVSDAADERRRYLNGCISQLDRGYLSAVMRYNAVLSERNRYLKVGSDEDMLSIYDRQLAEHGQAIYEKRKAFAERLQPLVGEYYALLSGRREQVELTYRSELAEAPFTELLQRARQRDLANQFTTAGIHRDDLVLRIDGYPLRKYGSQGQQKSFLVALKLAQYRIVGADKGEKPILLLDDLFDKLDMGRVEQLIKLVSGEEFGQIVITDCNKVRLETILGRQGGDYRLYVLANGEIAK